MFDTKLAAEAGNGAMVPLPLLSDGTRKCVASFATLPC